MRHACMTAGLAVLLGFAPLALAAAEAPAAADKPNTLTRAEIEEGWILLFDGETTFGWQATGEVKVEEGSLRVPAGATLTTTTKFGDFELRFAYKGEKPPVLKLNGEEHTPRLPQAQPGQDWMQINVRVQSTPEGRTTFVSASRPGSNRRAFPSSVKGTGRSLTTIGITAPEGAALELRSIQLKPLGTRPLFNGKDLSGWKPIPDRKSQFTVTDKGELNIKDGNGEIQTEGQWADFVLQLDVISHGKSLNSGIFFRALPGEFWQGYEAQIRNQWEGDDRTKPVDYGTGGVYNRQKSRKVVSSDNEWFTMTVVAHDLHVAVWVDGYQTADFVDKAAPASSARKGSFRGKGCISLQGHDPTTNLSFRNIRLAELAPPPAER